jgi:hypothetical protein
MSKNTTIQALKLTWKPIRTTLKLRHLSSFRSTRTVYKTFWIEALVTSDAFEQYVITLVV